MIDPEGRLWAGSGSLIIGGPYTWHITDLDQRRHFSVTYAPPVPVQDVEDTEDICMAQLQKHIDQLGDGVYGIRFSEPNGPVTISTDQEDDATWYINYHPLGALKLPFPIKTIYLSSLVEVDGLTPQIDLVTYQETPLTNPTKTNAVFGLWRMACSELGMSLIAGAAYLAIIRTLFLLTLSFLTIYPGGIVGFTSLFIPGSTLKDNTIRPFRLQWLHQLLSVVDDLNYRYGIMHQDMAARNLVIDQDDNLRIFDFN